MKGEKSNARRSKYSEPGRELVCPDYDSGASEGIEQKERKESEDIEQTHDDDVIPVPRDSDPVFPDEEPPLADDAPKKIVSDE